MQYAPEHTAWVAPPASHFCVDSPGVARGTTTRSTSGYACWVNHISVQMLTPMRPTGVSNGVNETGPRWYHEASQKPGSSGR